MATTQPARMMTVTLPHDVWQTVLGVLTDVADEQDTPVGCRDCDNTAPGRCLVHQEQAQDAKELRAIAGQIEDHLDRPTSANIAELIARTHMPLDSDIRGALIHLSNRSRNALLREGIRTLDDLARYDDEKLLAIPYFGQSMLAEVRSYLYGMAAR